MTPPNPLAQVPLAQLRRRTSAKWTRYPPDVLPVWVAEMDVPLAEPVLAAVRAALEIGDTGYPQPALYAEALAEFTGAQWGWPVDPGEVAVVPDVMTGIAVVLELVTGPGDAVVISPPVYAPFSRVVARAGRRLLEAPLGPDHRLDPAALDDAFARAAAGGGRAVYLLCSPHNPTGTVHTPGELAAVAELAARHGVRVVADEIHAPLVHAGHRHRPYLTMPGTDDAMALLSASKAFNLAGLRAAAVVGGPAARADLARMPDDATYATSHVAVLAQSAALREGGPWLDGLRAGLDENRQLLATLLARHLPRVRCRPPEGTYLAWLDCRELALGDDPAAVFLDRGRVALSPGPEFGTGGSGHARLNFATSPQLLTEAVQRMARAVVGSAPGR